MTEKDTKSLMAHSLYDMGQQLNELFSEGYTIREGWPIQYGYMYEIIGEKDVVEAPKKQVGRPKAV